MDKKERWGLNWKGRILVFLLLLACLIIITRNIVPYLSAEKPVKAKIVVIEGYVEDCAYPVIISKLEELNPDLILTTGTALDRGFYLSGIPSTAHLVAYSLISLGVDSTKIRIVSVQPDVLRNRTYHSAIATRKYLMTHFPDADAINLLSSSVHARRSHYLFKMVMHPEIETGNIVIPSKYFNRNDWFKSSRGFRVVVAEAIAWVYVRLFFWPDVEMDLIPIALSI